MSNNTTKLFGSEWDSWELGLVPAAMKITDRLMRGERPSVDELRAIAYDLNPMDIVELAVGELPSAEEFLGDICEREHASCNDNCPVFKLMPEGVKTADPFFCAKYRDGAKMLAFVKERMSKKEIIF